MKIKEYFKTAIFGFLGTTTNVNTKGEKGEKGDRGEKGEKGDSAECSLLKETELALVPEFNGIKKVMTSIFDINNLDKLSPEYTQTLHCENVIFDSYDKQKESELAYMHLKLLVVNPSDNTIVCVPSYGEYKEIFVGFRLVNGNANSGVDVSLKLSTVTKIIQSLTTWHLDKYQFNLYFYPDRNEIVRVKYSKIELLSSAIDSIKKRLDYLEDVVKEISFRDGI
jgi:hypothetical protein